MGDFDKSINRREDPSPYEKIIVNPIEKDRKAKEEGYSGLKNSTRSQAFATLVSFFKKILSTLPFKGKGSSALFDQQKLLDDIFAFRKMLLTLSTEDESHNPDFTQKLTELWHNLLDDCNSLSYSTASSSELLLKVNFFVSQIQNYPLGADHTLGYYFTEYAGREWIPFPFMELLQILHEDSKANPTQSMLSNWISLLNDILGPTTISR
jgi:hypothetical protein